MDRLSLIVGNTLLSLTLCAASTACAQAPAACGTPPVRGAEAAPSTPIDLAQRLAGGTLRAVTRVATPLDGRTNGVYLNAAEGPGVVWITDADLAQGTIAVDVCGRDVLQQSFVGV